MNDSAIIKGVYADYRRVKGRKVLQIIVEVPMEAAPLVHKAFGEPTPDGSTWVAVALLNNEKAKEKPDYRLSQQAAMCCNDVRFWQFLEEYGDQDVAGVSSEFEAATLVRTMCDVQSRSEFNSDETAAEKWRNLYGSYQAWLIT